MDSELTLRNAQEPRLVVGVGASGECEDALESLVGALPSDTGMAFVFARYLGSVELQRLCESLAQRTTMAVLPVDEETVLRPDHIYLIDAASELSFERGVTSPGPSTGWKDFRRGVDQLFGRLAQTFGSRTVGILLCAEGGEGIEGLNCIKSAGGLTIAQAPGGEESRGLAQAIESGAADLVIDVDYMPRSLVRFAELLSFSEGHALLAAIVSSSDDAIVSKTLNGTILSWNGAAERIFGYSAKEAVGQSIELIIPTELRGEERDILSKLRRGERIDHFETVRVAKNGQRLDISLTISPIRDKSGRIVAASKVARDITERKRAEAALKEANKRKDEYLAMLGHELRNPLAAIQSAGEVIKQGGSTNPSLAERGVAILERQASHMAKLLDGLLDVSRITRGKLEIERSQVNLTRVLTDLITGGERKAEREGVELHLELGDEPLYIQGDSTRLSQIFGNLIDNALKFTPSGGHIYVSAQVRDDMIEIVVRDTGMGFPPEQAEHLFDAFRQGPQDFSRSHGGLGLGLALARGLAELHGGSIQASSEGHDRGASFSVRLPRSAKYPTPYQEQDDSVVDALRIVIIEDNDDLAQMLRQWLTLQGHEVAVASTGEAGLACVRERHPDVVICDLGLPGELTGFDIARELRADPMIGDLGLVALSGYSRSKDKRMSREAGFDIHLTKPIEFSSLQQVLGELK